MLLKSKWWATSFWAGGIVGVIAGLAHFAARYFDMFEFTVLGFAIAFLGGAEIGANIVLDRINNDEA